MTAGKKVWKDYFLSSGIPLEYSVINKLKKYDLTPPKEFKYLRTNETGLLSEFSVDIHTTHIDTTRNLWLEFLIECKYRHHGTLWLFTPTAHDFLMPRYEDLAITLDQYDVNRRFNRDKIASYSKQYSLCGKGIEILKNDNNPKSIEQAIQQLQYAAVSKSADALIHQLDELLGSPTPIFMLLPIIVTTAEIWRLKDNISLEEIRKSNNIEEVAEQHEAIILHHEPDNFLIANTRNIFFNSIHIGQRAKFESVYNRTAGSTYDEFANTFADRNPSLFIVANYNVIGKQIQNLLNMAKDQDMIINR